MMSSIHHVIIAPSLVHQVLTNPKITSKFSGEPFFFGLMERVFGDEKQLMRNMDQKMLWGPVSKSVQQMMRESFLTPALQTLNDGVSERAPHLVSFQTDATDQQQWEQSASVRRINDGEAVVASLHPLLRDFVGHLAIEILLGPDFLGNFPDTLPDLFVLDATFSMLLSGLPQALAPSLKPGLAARSRLLKALKGHHENFLKASKGEHPDPRWSQVDKTSNVMADRIKAFAEAGDFDDSKPEEDLGMLSAVGNLVVLWALNVNANQVTFWMIFHIYSNPELLKQIRDEVQPFVRRRSNDDEKLNISLDGLSQSCPLLMGAFLETMRWESGATVYRCINEDFVLTESAEDARIFEHEVPQSYVFSKGGFIVVPNGTHQSDERYFPSAQTFDARRFWVRNEWEAKQPVEADIEDEKSIEGNWSRHDASRIGLEKQGLGNSSTESGIKVDYKTMHPWGGGSTVCKGKKFAEGEVLTFVAAIVSCWDMVRVDKDGIPMSGWGKHPGHKGGTGAVVPDADVWVKISRRKTSS